MLGANAQSWQPRLHALVAAGLVDAGWSQARVAAAIGTTQSSVSRWLTRPPPALLTAKDDAAVDGAAVSLVDQLIRTGVPSGLLTVSLTSMEAGCDWSVEMRLSAVADGDAHERAGLLSALSRLVSDMPVIPAAIRPAVGINVAVCTSTATDQADVAAFRGRLLMGDGSSINRSPPDFGASKHLSGILLGLRRGGAVAAAIINLRPPEDEVIETFATDLGLTLAAAPRGVAVRPADMLLDSGDFGWEPSLYITAPDLLSLGQRIRGMIGHCAV